MLVAVGEPERPHSFFLECAARERAGEVVGRGAVAQLDLVHGDGREIGEDVQFLRREAARLEIDGTDRPNILAALRGEWNAGIEADAGSAGDISALGEALVEPRIGHDDRRAAFDREAAETLLARDFIRRETFPGFVPLPVPVDHRHDGDGHMQHVADKSRDAVEGFLARRVENVEPVELGEPHILLCRIGRRSSRKGMGRSHGANPL